MNAVLDVKIGGMLETRLEFHFENWKRWMKKDDVTDGAPGKACGCVGGGYSQSFDDMVDSADVRCAQIMDSIVNSLSAPQRSAVYREYLYAVFRYERLDFQETLTNAKIRSAELLIIRGIY